MPRNISLPIAAVLLLLPGTLAGQTLPPPEHRQLARAIFQELIEINTSDSARQTRRAAQAMADRLIAGGIPRGDVQVVETSPGTYSSFV